MRNHMLHINLLWWVPLWEQKKKQSWSCVLAWVGCLKGRYKAFQCPHHMVFQLKWETGAHFIVDRAAALKRCVFERAGWSTSCASLRMVGKATAVPRTIPRNTLCKPPFPAVGHINIITKMAAFLLLSGFATRLPFCIDSTFALHGLGICWYSAAAPGIPMKPYKVRSTSSHQHKQKVYYW